MSLLRSKYMTQFVLELSSGTLQFSSYLCFDSNREFVCSRNTTPNTKKIIAWINPPKTFIRKTRILYTHYFNTYQILILLKFVTRIDRDLDTLIYGQMNTISEETLYFQTSKILTSHQINNNYLPDLAFGPPRPLVLPPE